MEGRYKGSNVKSAILLSLLLLFSLLFLWSMPYYEGEVCVFFPREGRGLPCEKGQWVMLVVSLKAVNESWISISLRMFSRKLDYF